MGNTKEKGEEKGKKKKVGAVDAKATRLLIGRGGDWRDDDNDDVDINRRRRSERGEYLVVSGGGRREAPIQSSARDDNHDE